MIMIIMQYLKAKSVLLLMILLGSSIVSDVWAQSEVKIEKKEKEQRVDVTIGGKHFTSYIYPSTIKKPVLYPLKTASGTMITRGFPLEPRPGERVDHPHHVGMWFNYGDVNGLDFWNNSDSIAADKRSGYGTIVHKKINKATGGKDKGELEITAEWVTPEGTVLLREDTKFIFSGDASTRSVERITTLTAQDKSVSFTDNKEGMLGIRMARQLEHPSNKPELFTDASGKVTNVPSMNNDGVAGMYYSSEGKEGDAVWGTRGKWVNLTGNINGENIAVVVMDHPRNVGHPTYWHARGYGLFAVNNLGQKALSNGKEELNFRLAPGKSVTFRHKVLIHSGDKLQNDQIQTAYQRFASGR